MYSAYANSMPAMALQHMLFEPAHEVRFETACATEGVRHTMYYTQPEQGSAYRYEKQQDREEHLFRTFALDYHSSMQAFQLSLNKLT